MVEGGRTSRGSINTQWHAAATIRATSKTKGPASWGLVLGGTTLNRAVAHFPIWRARQGKV